MDQTRGPIPGPKPKAAAVDKDHDLTRHQMNDFLALQHMKGLLAQTILEESPNTEMGAWSFYRGVDKPPFALHDAVRVLRELKVCLRHPLWGGRH